MANPVFNDAVIACLDEINTQLAEATQICESGAQARAAAGGLSEAVTISVDIEQLIYEAGRLYDAASLLSRLSRN